MAGVAAVGIVVAMAVPAGMRDAAVRHERDCLENLARIEGAAATLHLDGQRPEMGSLTPEIALNDLMTSDSRGYLTRQPVCHAGGTYRIGDNGAALCSIHGTLLTRP